MDNMNGSEIYGKTIKVNIAKAHNIVKNRAVWENAEEYEEIKESELKEEIEDTKS